MFKNLINIILGNNKGSGISGRLGIIRDVTFILATVLLATLLGIVFHRYGFSDVTVIAWYILAVQIIAVRISGIHVNAIISLICVIVFNFSDILSVFKRIKMAKRPDFAARTFQSQ